MRVLLVTHYYPPEIGAPQARLSEHARHWVEAGETVTVLTGMPNHPTGVVPPRYRRRLRCVETADGVRVVRTWLYATPNEGFVRKTIGHLSFMVTSVLLGGRTAGPADVVVVSSPTFFSVFSAWLLARLRRAAFVLEVRDLWPAVFVDLGVLTSRPIIRILEWLELHMYGAADHVVVVTEGFRDDLVRRGVPADKVSVIRNGVDLERFRGGTARDIERDLRAVLGAGPNDTLALYIGAHGISHGLDAVVDAARLLEGQPIRIAFVGEGARRGALQGRVRELGLTNVTMHPGVPRDEVPGYLRAADICLVPLRDVPLFTTFIPSKLFEFLGAEKAVIGAVDGEPAEILRAAGAVVVPPDNAQAIADAITELAGDPARRAAMGKQGRAYVEQHFDRRALATRYMELLRTVASTSASTRTGSVRKSA